MENFSDFISKYPVVIDNGSGITKAGLAEDTPKLIFPTQFFKQFYLLFESVGKPKYKAVLPTANQAESQIGNLRDELRGLLKLKYPISHGVINDWQKMDQIWKYIFSELKVDPKERPVLITQPPLNPRPQIAKLAALFFDSYQVPAFFIALQGVLTLYAAGKTTGVVLDSGDGVTYSVPVFEGFALEHAQKRIDIGGRDVTEYLVDLLRRAGYSFSTTAEFEIVKKIKEKRCTVNIELSQTEKFFEEKKNKDIYILPDGELIQLSDEKKQAPEILFNPEKIGSEALSITELVVTSIKKTDMDLRKTLYQEIVLAGGNTMFQCFPERILFEIKKLIAKDTYIKIYAPPERNLLCWMGGSILSNLNSFRNMWITKKEYDDEGEAILYKKSF